MSRHSAAANLEQSARGLVLRSEHYGVRESGISTPSRPTIAAIVPCSSGALVSAGRAHELPGKAAGASCKNTRWKELAFGTCPQSHSGSRTASSRLLKFLECALELTAHSIPDAMVFTFIRAADSAGLVVPLELWRTKDFPQFSDIGNKTSHDLLVPALRGCHKSCI